jgi:hypothetical protein
VSHRRRLGDQQPIPGHDSRVLGDAEGELALVDQAEHQPGPLVPDRAERLADRGRIRVDLGQDIPARLDELADQVTRVIAQ